MSTRAVTAEAPAVSERNSTIPPQDEHYRLTGERSDESERDPREVRESNREPVEKGIEHKDESVNQEASAASNSDDAETAAASAAADTQKNKGPAQTKTAKTSESRWAKLSREAREWRERAERAETAAKSSTEAKRDPQQSSQTATEDKAKVEANAEPQIEDVDPKTGKPKYTNVKEFMAAHAKWNRAEAIREFQSASEKTQREQQLQQSERIIEKTMNERATAARKDHPDYDELYAAVIAEKDEHGQPALFYTKGSHLDGFFLDSERSHDVFHELFKNFDAHKHIFARDVQGRYLLNPVRQLRELSKIENSLPEKGKAQNSSARQVTQAHRPPHQVSGKGTVTKDAVEQALENRDGEAYRREANARDPRYIAALAALNKGK